MGSSPPFPRVLAAAWVEKLANLHQEYLPNAKIPIYKPPSDGTNTRGKPWFVVESGEFVFASVANTGLKAAV